MTTVIKGFRFKNFPNDNIQKNANTMFLYYMVFRAIEGDWLADELLKAAGWKEIKDADDKVIWSAMKTDIEVKFTPAVREYITKLGDELRTEYKDQVTTAWRAAFILGFIMGAVVVAALS